MASPEIGAGKVRTRELEAASQSAGGFFRVLYAFVLRARDPGNLGDHRLRAAIFGGGRTRQHFWSAVSSGKVRGGWTSHSQDFL